MKSALIILFTTFILAGCTKESTSINSTPESDAGQTQPTTPTDNGELAEISNAIASGQPVVCTLKNDGDTSMTYYLKGNKFKIAGMGSGESENSTNIISDGVFVYTWSDQSKTGTKVPVTEPLPSAGEETAPNYTPNDLKNFQDQGYTVDCDKGEVADSEFVIPTDVTFTDLSEMMGGASIPTNLPEPEQE